MGIRIATATAPVNIATLKYWGKRDVKLNLPTNNSISVTLDQADLRTLTSAACSEQFEKDELWLNGELSSLSSQRTQDCLKDLRDLRRALESRDETREKIAEWKLRIVSENNFPTAAGLASSAAGFAALVYAIAQLYELPEDASEISKIARKGSGSACRSLYGGYVAWQMGQEEDGSDSKAVQIADVNHWPQMKAAILVASADKKDTPSTSGMQLTVATSDLFQQRIKTVVPIRFEEMKQAILARDFSKFAELTMKDSNSFHATCLDSFPPIFYMNDTSRRIIKLCHLINDFYNETVVAYTYDAGPNAVLYYLEENEDKVMSFLYKCFQDNRGWDEKFEQVRLDQFVNLFENEVRPSLQADLNEAVLSQGVTRIIFTKVGSCPQIKGTSEALIDEQTGLPLNVN